jgi:hypothetical protein
MSTGKSRDEYQLIVIRHVWERIQYLNQHHFSGKEDTSNDASSDGVKKKKHSSGHLFVQKGIARRARFI